jgi:hypothetical protein
LRHERDFDLESLLLRDETQGICRE